MGGKEKKKIRIRGSFLGFWCPIRFFSLLTLLSYCCTPRGKEEKKKINHDNNQFCIILVCQSVYMTKYLNVFWDISFCNYYYYH